MKEWKAWYNTHMNHEPEKPFVHDEESSEERGFRKEGEATLTTRLKEKPKRDLTLPISILIAAVMVAGALVFVALYHGGGNGAANSGAGVATTAGTGVGTSAATAPATTASATTTAAILALGPRDAVLGSPNAPVTIIEYGDYQCPFCGEYFKNIQPTIVKDYINTGKARMVFRDFPFLGAESTAAANAAQCANNQHQFWAYHDALYNAKLTNDAAGGGENDGFFTQAEFLRLATQVGLNTKTFTTCLNNDAEANYVAQEKASGTIVGVNSTPTTFVNGKMVAANGSSVGYDPTAVIQAIGAAVAAAK